MDLGDLIVVDHPRHPLHGCVGKVVGRRGQRTPDDPWLLVFMPSRMRSFLIPQSILRLEKAAANHSDHTLQ